MQDSEQKFEDRPDKPHGQKNEQSSCVTTAEGHPDSENTAPSTARSVVPSASTEMAEGPLFGPSKGNIGIKGGEFNVAGRDRINITNIIKGYWKTRNSIGSRRPPGINRLSASAGGENAREVENRTKKGSIVKQAASDVPQTPERQPCDIYYQYLASKRRGSPLYIPGPNQNLPKEYQRTGTRIGDVGMISEAGYFVFLFNICHPANHSINNDRVPANFQQLSIQPFDIEKHSVFNENSYIASASIKKSYPEGDSSCLKFRSSACEGAILTMPMGSNTEDAGNLEIFRKYMKTHIADWYRYVKIVRGRSAKNGDLRLVTGYDKASLWGMAIFSDSTAEEDSLLLEFQPVIETNGGRTYKWKHSGSAEVRSGPGAQELKNLRKGDPDPGRRTYQNQCLFVRTLNGTLQENIWKRLAAECGEVEVDEGPSLDDTSSQSSSYKPARSSRTTTESTTRSSANVPGGRTALAAIDDIPVDGPMRLGSVIPRETNLAYHPSDAINKMLLRLNPFAQVALTHDKDWISAIHKDDFVLPSVEQLRTRIMESSSIWQDNDVVFLKKRYVTWSPGTDSGFEDEDSRFTNTYEPDGYDPDEQVEVPASFIREVTPPAILEDHIRHALWELNERVPSRSAFDNSYYRGHIGSEPPSAKTAERFGLRPGDPRVTSGYRYLYM